MSNIDFKEYQAAFHYQNDDILHFGILGMKWGVRRYQNEDGTLTSAGKKRYDDIKKKAADVGVKGTELYNQGKTQEGRKLWRKSNKLNQKASKYGTQTPEEKEIKDKIKKEIEEKRTEEKKTLLKEGWEESKYYNNSVEKEENGQMFSLVAGDTGSFNKSKQHYNEFRKNEKEHVNTIIDQLLKNDRFNNWTDNKKQLEKELRNAKNAYEFRDDGILYGFIGNYGIPELGYHSVEIEYDILKKKLATSGLAG